MTNKKLSFTPLSGFWQKPKNGERKDRTKTPNETPEQKSPNKKKINKFCFNGRDQVRVLFLVIELSSPRAFARTFYTPIKDRKGINPKVCL